MEARVGSRAKAGQVAGNFNTLIVMRVKELATAQLLTDQLPRVEVFTLMDVSGVDDSTDPVTGVDFRSRNEDRIAVTEVPMLTPAELVRLPKGQAFALLEGGRLWKLRIPRPVDGEESKRLHGKEQVSTAGESEPSAGAVPPAGPAEPMDRTEGAEAEAQADTAIEVAEQPVADG